MTDPMFFDPEKQPSSALDLALGAYYNEFLEYWEQQNVRGAGELNHFQRARAAVFIRLAAALPESLHSLLVGDSARSVLQDFVTEEGAPIVKTYQESVILARIATLFPVTRQAVQLEIAFQAIGDVLPKAEQRVFTLLELLAERELSSRAGRYLDRATRLFLWGFDPECVAFSGAVLEAALKERIPDNAKRRIQRAVELGLFTPEQAKLADELRSQRNNVLHEDPTITLTAEKAIRSLAGLLDVLYPVAESDLQTDQMG
jgi:hypothetical protein